jgi:hypothetical protein
LRASRFRYIHRLRNNNVCLAGLSFLVEDNPGSQSFELAKSIIEANAHRIEHRWEPQPTLRWFRRVARGDCTQISSNSASIEYVAGPMLIGGLLLLGTCLKFAVE